MKKGFMDFSTFENAKLSADIISKSKGCPEHLRGKPEDILVQIQFGLEIGLSPIQSLHALNFSDKGKAYLPAKTLLGLCYAHESVEDIHIEYDSEKEEMTLFIKRSKNHEYQYASFSKADAEKAGLLEKEAYQKYLKDMLKAKAIQHCLDDHAQDLIKGCITREEVYSHPEYYGDMNKSIQTNERDDILLKLKRLFPKYKVEDYLNKNKLKSLDEVSNETALKLIKHFEKEI